MVIETASSPGPFRNTQMSKAAQTHKLRKLRAPSKCRECDGLVVFHGAECEEVTLVSFLSLFFLIIYFRSNRTKMQHNHDLLFGTLVKSSVPTAFRVLQIPRWALPKFHNGLFITHGEQKSNKNKSERPPLPSSKYLNKGKSWNWPQVPLRDQIHQLVSAGGAGSGNWGPFVQLLRSPLHHPCAPSVYFRSSFFPYLLDTIHRTRQ